MNRRDFIRLGSAGLTAAGTGVQLGDGAQAAAVCTTTNTSGASFGLEIDDAQFEMIDGQRFTFLAYRLTRGSANFKVPGPVFRVVEGTTVSISITNRRPETHGFEITGIPDSKAVVLPNRTCTVTFTAPEAGTYIYHDATHASRHLYRLLGLHGAFIVHPVDGMTRRPGEVASITPYSLDKQFVTHADAADTIGMVFNAFGTVSRFPGGKWVPCALDQAYSNQEKIWVFNQVDPRFNALIRPTGMTASTMTTGAAQILDNFTPRYFTINGRSGYDLTTGEDVVCSNWIGEPTLIRTMNVGLAHQATHIHGNHLLELAHSAVARDGFQFLTGSHRDSIAGEVVLHETILERDVWPTAPMQARDMLLPYEVPPDIPNWNVFASGTNQEPFPLKYVMHCHCEMSQTAAGGNYPQGAVTHWEVMGPLGGRTGS